MAVNKMPLLLLGITLSKILAPGVAVRTDGSGHASDPFDLNDPLNDPFGDVLPPLNMNPNTRVNPSTRARDPVQVNEERLLVSESLLDDQVELREEERMEVLCGALGRNARDDLGARESSTYDAEQDAEAAEERDVRTWVPTDAEHRCLPIKTANKYMPGKLLGLPDSRVPVPVFPERLGELVIEAVTHTDKASKKHIVLEVTGCSSCENDATATVEWSGLLPLDGTGKPTGMKKGTPSGEMQTKLVEGPSSSSNPRKFSFSACPKKLQKYVKRYQYKYSSYHFDEVVEPEMLTLVEDIPMDEKVDTLFLVNHNAEHDGKAVKLMEDLKAQVKHIPFNHKLEQLHMSIKTCDLVGESLSCPDAPQESLILHDGGLVVSSAQTLLFDEIGRASGAQCAYGPCLDSSGKKRYIYKGEGRKAVPYSFTMCSECGSKQCPASRTIPKPESRTSGGLPRENFFNCLVERVYAGSSYIDMMHQAENDKYSKTPSRGNGFLYRGTTSPGHIEGHINWHITIPPKSHCEPVLQDAVYVGMGVDEADRCKDYGGVDVDIGMILIKCTQDERNGYLGDAVRGGCEYYDHLNFAKKSPKKSSTWYGISGDNRGGEGEGDDEWVFVDLAGARQQGVTHVVLMANIFGCAQHKPDPPLQWSELEGAFMRVTASGKAMKQFTSAETISYVDLDEMRGGANAGAAVYILYLGSESKLAVPSMVKDHKYRKDDAANANKAWKLLSLKQPLPGTYVGQSFEHVANLLYQRVIEAVPERTLEGQTLEMALPDTISTGQNVRHRNNNDEVLEAIWTDDLQDVISEGIQEDLRHPQPNENAHEKRARTLTEEQFQAHFSEYLPEGAPGTDSFCV